MVRVDDMANGATDAEGNNAFACENDLGVVVIGRNEGERLKACLRSVVGSARAVVYVDSGSTDSSLENAERLGAIVARLDRNQPFTAARARNHGLSVLLYHAPDLSAVQFVDGDCEVVPHWLQTGLSYLATHPNVGAVAGQRRERFPERSVYNLLCDIEWRATPGPARYFGGDVMIRVPAITAAGGYRDALIAGEDPELALRIRRQGWNITILPDLMTLHDANMTRAIQWWHRTKRAGYAYAEGAKLHGAGRERHWVRESRRSILWVLVPPGLALVSIAAIGPAGIFPLLLYPAAFLRLAMGRSDLPPRSRVAWAFFTTAGKFPEFLGQVSFWRHRLIGRHASLIEYK